MSEVMEAMSEMQDFDSARRSEFFFKLAAERFCEASTEKFPKLIAARFSSKISDMLMIAESGVFSSWVMAERNSQEEKVEVEVGWSWVEGEQVDNCAEADSAWVWSGFIVCD